LIADPAPPPSSRATLALAGVAFLLSGASALLYQVAWQRILALHTGVGIESVAMIVAAFMTGLGLGSTAGGLLSARLAPRAALLAFAALELLVGLYGAASGWLLYDVLYLRGAWLYTPPWRGALLHFVTLLPPTVLMGMSLPFLARALVSDVRTAARILALLYGLNVLGGALGALAAPWVFIRQSGVRGALLAAAGGNLGAAVATALLALGRRARAVSAAPAPVTSAPERAPEPLARLALLYALSGFCALALEILWFRVVEVAVKSTAYTFGTVLAVYLGGIGAGSLCGAFYAPRLRRPLRAFLLGQCLLLALSGLALCVLVALPPDTPGFRWYVELWSTRRSFNFGGAWSWPAVLRLYLALPLLLFGAPTALMGFSFMALQSAVQDDVRSSGRKVGLLQAANLVGCVAGSLAFGLVALHHLGTMGALRLLLLAGIAFALLGLRRAEGRRAFVVAAVGLAVLAAALPGSRALWLRLHGLHDPRVLIGEDATGVAALSPLDDAEAGWRVWVSGRHHSRLPFGGVHTALGAIPALLHPAPAEAAVIGLGSGDTAWAAGCRREATRRVTVFEICAPQVDLLRQLARSPEPPAKLPRFLADPRLQVVVADGRNALEQGAARFDVIEMDALFPTSPYSGNLYSVEFYSLCARRLRPGGLMCTWAPTGRVRASFARAFPYVLEFGDGTILAGSGDPIALDWPAWRDRARSAAVRAYLGEGRAEAILALLRTARPMPAAGSATINEDLFPRDEYNVR
jgi:predicted membrane-bound spermidine synthase